MKSSVKTAVTALFLCVLLALAGMLFFGQRGFRHLMTLQEQFAALEEDNRRIAEENERLKKEIELLHENMDYIEDIARKQLGLVKKDELVYQLQPPDESGSAAP